MNEKMMMKASRSDILVTLELQEASEYMLNQSPIVFIYIWPDGHRGETEAFFFFFLNWINSKTASVFSGSLGVFSPLLKRRDVSLNCVKMTKTYGHVLNEMFFHAVQQEHMIVGKQTGHICSVETPHFQ